MDTSLVTNGLPEFSLAGLATTGTIGGNSAKVKAACENLQNCANGMDAFIEDLECQKESILSGWNGEAAEALRSGFPGLLDAFRSVPVSVRSISDWATTTMNSYAQRDAETAGKISAILGGR